MSEDSQEKQHKPSAKRLDDLRKKGTFLRARDMNSGAILVISILVLLLMSKEFFQVIRGNFLLCFSSISKVPAYGAAPNDLYYQLALNGLYLLIPMMVLLFVTTFFFAFLFGGFGFSFSLVKFKADRLSLFKNLKKIFSLNNFMELFKSILKLVLFFSILIFFIYGRSESLLKLVSFNDETLVGNGLELIQVYLLLIIAGIAIIIAVDMLYSYYSFQNKIKMTSQELKEEQKETDGSPEVKRRIRQAQFAISRQRIKQDVPKATVVITNPTHYSVALRYDETTDNAPKILAMGVDNVAAEIRLIAVKHAIPIYEAPQLARAIFYTGKVGANIHPELYMAVAIVLSYVAQLKNYQLGLSKMPAYVQDLQIPKEFQFKGIQ